MKEHTSISAILSFTHPQGPGQNMPLCRNASGSHTALSMSFARTLPAMEFGMMPEDVLLQDIGAHAST